MVWVLYSLAVAMVIVLACVFVRMARAIRRDVDDRFRRVEAHLEEEANDVVKDLLGGTWAGERRGDPGS